MKESEEGEREAFDNNETRSLAAGTLIVAPLTTTLITINNNEKQ